MSRSLQNRLKQHEERPPATVWSDLSSRLDAEFVPSDLELSSKLQDAGISPPSSAWETIAAALATTTALPDTSENAGIQTAGSASGTGVGERAVARHRSTKMPAEIPARKAPVLPLVVRRIAVAAATAALVLLGAFYLLSDRGDTTGEARAPLVAGPQRQEHLLIAPADEKAESAAPPGPGALASAPSDLSATPPRSRRAAPPAPRIPVTEFPDDIEQANPLAVQTVSPMVPVTVSAPPIRDEEGNLIMDIQVISDPGQPYIVVTSPNGDQTRISRKFLHYLSYLNGDYSYADMNSEGQQWKTRFEEWRNELLKEASFIPTANNFFDIFQLKELIEDR